ncbi:MAG: hypothetical protein ACYST6_10785 [Planctomycetota bacterium]
MIIYLIILILANYVVVALLLRRLSISVEVLFELFELAFYIAVVVALTRQGIVRLFSAGPARYRMTTNEP